MFFLKRPTFSFAAPKLIAIKSYFLLPPPLVLRKLYLISVLELNILPSDR